MKKKILALLMAMCMVFGMTSVALAAEVTTLESLGSNTVALEAGDSEGKTYSYTVPENTEGTVMITVSATSADADYMINVDNLTSGAYGQIAYYPEYDLYGTPAQIKAVAGDEIKFVVKAYPKWNNETSSSDYSALNITWEATSKTVGTESSPEEISTMSQYGEFSYNGITSVATDGSKYYYEYIAETTGVLSVYLDEWTCNPGSIEDLNAEVVMKNVYTEKSVKYSTDTVDYVVTTGWGGSNTYKAIQLDVTAGDIISFEFSSAATSVDTATIGWCAAIAQPAGSEGNPIQITAAETTVEVPVGEGLYFQVPYEYLEMAEIVYVTGGSAMLVVDGSQRFVPGEDGAMDAQFLAAVSATYNGPIFAIVNIGEADAEFEITFEFPAGSKQNPEEIEDTKEHTFLEGDNSYYYYTFTAPEDGIITMDVTSNAEWSYSIDNMTSGAWGSYVTSLDEEIQHNVMAVNKGDVISIYVSAAYYDEEMCDYVVNEDTTVKTTVKFVASVGAVMDVEDINEIISALWNNEYDEDGYIIINVDGEEIVENPATVIPAEVLTEVRDYNTLYDAEIVIMLITDDYMWYIDATDMEADPVPVDLGLTFAEDNGNIPEATIEAIANGNEWGVFSIAHNGNFGFDAVLEFIIDVEANADYIGKTVALYWYNNNELELVGEKYVIDETGIIAFAMTHASDYVLVIEGTADEDPGVPPTGDGTTPPPTGDGTTPPATDDGTITPPATGDSTNFALWFAVLALGVAAIAGSVVMRKREF